MRHKGFVTCIVLLLAALPALATTPVVKTVPWVAGSPGVPHDTISGVTITCKATTNVSGSNFEYKWDFGDGTSTAYSNVTNAYNIGAAKAYSGFVGQTFTATVTVRDKTTGEFATGNYYTSIRATSGPNLGVEVNMAIDKSLWYMHTAMGSRSGSGAAITGNWSSSGGQAALFTNAFLVNGHKPDPDPANPNPYAETVMRGLNYALTRLNVTSTSNRTNPYGTYSTDGNSNGNRTYEAYQHSMYTTGMFTDMLVATGTPLETAKVGVSGIVGQTYKDIAQDLVDWYVYCQATSGWPLGGWRYSCGSESDNSVCQWAAIGMLAARECADPTKDFCAVIPNQIYLANKDWLTYSHDGNGFGYTSSGYYVWNPWAVTPSGLVQLAMDKVGRGGVDAPTKWDNAEKYLRTNFSGPLSYYYGLFSLTKAFLLYDDGTPGGKHVVHEICGRDAHNNLTNCIDWYGAETTAGAPMNGVARTLVNTQSSNGSWSGHEYSSEQYPFETGWATIMLNKTVFQSGLPVAVIKASPTSVASGGKVNFTGKDSFHQDGAKEIVSWEWDFNNDGVYEASGVNQNNIVFTAVGPPWPVNKPVKLRVWDNNVPPLSAITTMNIAVTGPPIAPTANAGGPYNICPQAAYLPFYLNGTGSSNPDNGGHDAVPAGLPGDYIKEYAWDLLGNGTYTAMNVQPRVDDYYAAQGKLGTGTIIQVGLRVTDNTAASYPSSGQPDLQGFATAQVYLRGTADQFCTKCVNTAQALPKAGVGGKSGNIQLLWVETGAHHYNIYRGTANGGPYTLIATVQNTVLGTGKNMAYTDNGPLTAGVAYYYRIAPATIADIETCQSNQANASGTIPKVR